MAEINQILFGSRKNKTFQDFMVNVSYYCAQACDIKQQATAADWFITGKAATSFYAATSGSGTNPSSGVDYDADKEKCNRKCNRNDRSNADTGESDNFKKLSATDANLCNGCGRRFHRLCQLKSWHPEFNYSVLTFKDSEVGIRLLYGPRHFLHLLDTVNSQGIAI